MERTYENHVARAEAIIKNFEDEVKEAQETGCEMMVDWRYSPEGRIDNIKNLKVGLQEEGG